MIYIYSTSFQSLFFAIQNYSFKDIFIVTTSDHTKEFCEKLKIKCDYWPGCKDKSLFGLLKYKKFIKKKAENYSGDEFLFSIYNFDLFGLFFIKQVRKKNKVYYVHQDHLGRKKVNLLSSIPLFFSKDFRPIINPYIIYSILLGMQLKIFELMPNHFVLGIDPSIFKKIFIELDTKQINKYIYKENSIHIQSLLKIPNYDIIYIDDGAGNWYQIKEINNILKLLKENNLSVAIKPHPTETLEIGLENTPILPKFIPSEIFFSYANKSIIGVVSATFEYKTEEIKKISLLKMVKWESKSNEEYSAKFMYQIADDILYPTNESELLNLISNNF